MSTIQPQAEELAPARRVGGMSHLGALLGMALRVSDQLVLVFAGLLACWLQADNFAMDLVQEQTIARAVLFGLIVFSVSSIYKSWRGRSLAQELVTLGFLWLIVLALSLGYSLAFKLQIPMSRLWWGLWFAGAMLLSSASRLVVRGVAGWVRARGYDVRRAVIVGVGLDSARVLQALTEEARAGIQVVGWFDTRVDSRFLRGVPYLGGIGSLAVQVKAHAVDQVWIALPMSAQDEILHVLDALKHSTADIRYVPDIMGMQLLNHSVEEIAGLPVLNLRMSPLDGNTRLLKAVEDRLLAFLILILIAPLMALIAIAVKMDSPGPILFRQLRHGRDGRVIEVWKFRSMRTHAEHAGQVTQATRHDPRITRLGAFLRRSSLDELPQFINVLQGTMSVVGPRPHAIEHNHHYSKMVRDYMQRHRVKPGITGWAQINGLRGETDTVEKMQARVEYDLYYLQNWSLLFDLRIVGLTVLKGFFGKNAY